MLYSIRVTCLSSFGLGQDKLSSLPDEVQCGRRSRRQSFGVDELADCVLLEGDVASWHGALVVAVNRVGEQLVVKRGIDNEDGEDVAGEGERVEGDAETVGAEAAVGEGSVEGGEGLAVVVDGVAVAVVLVVAEDFLRELPLDVAPEREVLGDGVGHDRAGLEDPSRE